MTCIVDTASINLTVAAGQLSADLTVDPGAGLPPNPLTVNPAGVYVIGSDGWIPLPTTLAFSSADGHTFVATTSADLRSFIGAGDKIRVVQSGVPAYFFVTAIAAGTITLYGGTLYTLAASAITLPNFSKAASPAGFTRDTSKWTEELGDTSDRSQASPVSGTWYNPGSLSLAVPIGVWRLYYEGLLYANNPGTADTFATLSTANNSESDPDLTSAHRFSSNANVSSWVHKEKTLPIAVKTSYFLNVKTDAASVNPISMRGDLGKTFVRAEIAYR